MFWKKKKSKLTDDEVKVFFPKEIQSLAEFEKDDLPGIVVVNSSLKEFEQREIFGYHLSLIMDYEDLIENGMPSQKERDVVDPFCDKLDDLIKGDNKEKPNALFLARVTWNATKQMLWRVYDPEIANKILQDIIQEDSSPRQFDFKMVHDIEWKETDWYLNNIDDK
jgi:hypothetical protein